MSSLRSLAASRRSIRSTSNARYRSTPPPTAVAAAVTHISRATREIKSSPQGAGGAVRQFSWLRNYAQVDTTSVLENTVAVQWHDGHESEYNVTWLRVNCPSSLHKSGQKVVTPRDVDPALRPAEVSGGQESVPVALLHCSTVNGYRLCATACCSVEFTYCTIKYPFASFFARKTSDTLKLGRPVLLHLSTLFSS